MDVHHGEAIVERIHAQAAAGNIFLTQHARQEMVDEAISSDEIVQALTTCQLLENYPEFYKGPCCLVGGWSGKRPIHLVCSSSRPSLVIITVYEPQPPRWLTPTQRGRKGS